MALSTCHGAESKKGQVPRLPGGGGKPRGKELRPKLKVVRVEVFIYTPPTSIPAFFRKSKPDL